MQHMLKNYFIFRKLGGGRRWRIMQMFSLLIPKVRYSERSAQDLKTESQIRTMHHAKVLQGV